MIQKENTPTPVAFEVLVSINRSMHMHSMYGGNIPRMVEGEWSLYQKDLDTIEQALVLGIPVIVTACYHGRTLTSYKVNDVRTSRRNQGVCFSLGEEVTMSSTPRIRKLTRRGYRLEEVYSID
jgi:hypothetical protein